MLWHWRAIKSFGKNWTAVFQSIPPPPRKRWIFFQEARRVKFSNFMGLFCLKAKLSESKLSAGMWFCDTEGSWKIRLKTESWFPNLLQKRLVNFLLPGKNGRIFKFYWFVLPQRKIARTKDFYKSFILWHSKAMENLVKSWAVVSYSAENEWVNFFAVDERGRMFKFYWFALSKR